MTCNRIVRRAAGAVALGAVLGLGSSTARAQAPVTGPVVPAPARYYYGVNSPYGYAELYGRAYYAPTTNLNGYNYGPVRDWASGRPVRLAKPWMLPLPR